MNDIRRLLVLGIVTLSGSAARAAGPPELPASVRTGLEKRAVQHRIKESSQGPNFCGGRLAGETGKDVKLRTVLDYAVFLGDLSSGAAAKAGAEFDGFIAGDPWKPVKLRIRGEPVTDPCTARDYKKDVKLYEVEVNAPGTGTKAWQNPCEGIAFFKPDQCETAEEATYQRGMAVAVQGAWGERGEHVPASDKTRFFTLACVANGVVGKCAHWGYRPWVSAPMGGAGSTRESDMHQICVRAARADYCGTGASITCEGTDITFLDPYDPRPRAVDGTRKVDAEWGLDGALCIGTPRMSACSSRAKLLARIKASCLSASRARAGGKEAPPLRECAATCPADAPTCGSPMRTLMDPRSPGKKPACDAAVIRAYCG